MASRLTLRSFRKRSRVLGFWSCFVLFFNLLLAPLTDNRVEASSLQALQAHCLSGAATTDPVDADNNGLARQGSICLFCGPDCTMGGCAPALRLHSAILVTQPAGTASLSVSRRPFAALIAPFFPAPFHRAQAPPSTAGRSELPSFGGCA